MNSRIFYALSPVVSKKINEIQAIFSQNAQYFFKNPQTYLRRIDVYTFQELYLLTYFGLPNKRTV